ncbi:MAG: Maf family protein [Acidimicrobiales bacterium]
MSDPAEPTRPPLVLASSSPRRVELLALLGLEFEARSADIDETPLANEGPEALLLRLAEQKATTVAALIDHPAIVIGADTIVVCDGEILGKPVDDADASAMLRRLSGRAHTASTGVAVVGIDGTVCAEVATTRVVMHEISEADIAWYLSTGEPFDKAGSYALQGHGGLFVASIEGSMHNVVGLPLDVTRRLLANAGVSLAAPVDRR